MLHGDDFAFPSIYRLLQNSTFKIGWKTALGLVISNMIGTGVFTSLGFQLLEVQGTWSIIILWSLGGVIALIGAFTYAELGTHFKDSGGDYIFLSRTFHPFLGYLYAWTSLTVGFSAPVAIAAMAMTDYLQLPPDIAVYANWISIGIIVALAGVHTQTIRVSSRFQNYASVIKLVFVGLLILVGFLYLPYESNALQFDSTWSNDLWKPGFAVSLIYVTYAYQGWNSAAYIVDEIRDPRRNLPIALIGGTVVVTLVYVLLQLVFLRHASLAQLEGQVEVASIAFANIAGDNWAKFVSYFIAIQLIATISGYLWIGSRITYAMAKEHRLWQSIAVKTEGGVPVRAIWLQVFISSLLTLSGTFEQVMIYAGFLLQLMSTLTVASIFFIEDKADTFKGPFGHKLQLFYILFSIVVLSYLLYERPLESLMGLGILVIGGATFFMKRKKPK